MSFGPKKVKISEPIPSNCLLNGYCPHHNQYIPRHINNRNNSYLRDAWIRTQRAAEASRRTANLATHLPTWPPISLLATHLPASHPSPSYPPISQLSHPSPYLATHLLPSHPSPYLVSHLPHEFSNSWN